MDDLRYFIVRFSLSFQLLSAAFSKQEVEAERPTSGPYLQSRRGSRQVFDCEGNAAEQSTVSIVGVLTRGWPVWECVCVCVHMRKQVQSPACIIAPLQHLYKSKC